MFLDGIEPVALGTVSDQLRATVWYRRENQRVFETMLNLYANVISINPEVSKKVESMVGDYLESVVPGSAEIGKQVANTTIKKQGEALESIFNSLKGYSQKQAIANKLQ